MDNTMQETPKDFTFIGEVSTTFEVESFHEESHWKQMLKRVARNKGSVFGFMMIIFISFMALAGPLFSGYEFDQQISGHESMAPRIPLIENLGIFDGSETLKTSTGELVVNKYETLADGEDVYHWFGTDVLGRDLFTRTWMGTRISLYIALVAVIVDVLFGMTYGMVSGYYGGAIDTVMQRVLEIINGIPSLVVVTLLIIILKPGLLSITLAIAITGWIGMSRIARASMLKLKDSEYVLAARTMGAKDITIMFKEVLPNIFSQLLIMSMFSIPNAIFTEAFLAFVGIGIPVPMASLGSLISENFKSLTTHFYMIIPPVLILGLLMLSFNLLADGLRDALDPTLKEV
ncbi:ABC transporter permease [Jeotgalibaca sp. MA1X17-3]|uniref:ABC transporter permease n=1 Tax=Jeotgalibaca sp. MA1X17-3 TaxID=2908211 RepID=UPI001F41A065|nr:ABC transporter permease [Jeotgalibaca sp. MA1X17-3]UJF15646.1 ABC transporter permease [Jeotgalibaca sp. MA1X17-3]